MRLEGFEPPRAFAHVRLRHACLPFHHSRVSDSKFTGQDLTPTRSSIRWTLVLRLIRTFQQPRN
jgi:hypothetical protein